MTSASQFTEPKAPVIKAVPTGQVWRELLETNLKKWEKTPNYSSNWFDVNLGPREVTYATGKDKGGYRSGMEGVYRALAIDKTKNGYKVTFFSPMYGIQNDTFNTGVETQRIGAGFKVGNWAVGAEQAYRALDWQKQTGLFEYE